MSVATNAAGAAGSAASGSPVNVGSAAELKRIVSFDMWSEVLGLFVGFLLPELLRRTTGGTVPDEAYGIATMAVSLYFFDGSWSRAGAVGGGLHVVDSFMNRRLAVADRITGMA